MMQKLMQLLGVSQAVAEPETGYMMCKKIDGCFDGHAFMCADDGTCRDLRGCC